MISTLITLAVLVTAVMGSSSACEASGGPVCSMGCGMDMSQPSGCCCQLDQQSGSSQPLKVALNPSPVLPKSPAFPGGGFELSWRISPCFASSFRAGACVYAPRGGLAFLGCFLI
jgi:hypothetical protein